MRGEGHDLECRLLLYLCLLGRFRRPPLRLLRVHRLLLLGSLWSLCLLRRWRGWLDRRRHRYGFGRGRGRGRDRLLHCSDRWPHHRRRLGCCRGGDRRLGGCSCRPCRLCRRRRHSRCRRLGSGSGGGCGRWLSSRHRRRHSCCRRRLRHSCHRYSWPRHSGHRDSRSCHSGHRDSRSCHSGHRDSRSCHSCHRYSWPRHSCYRYSWPRHSGHRDSWLCHSCHSYSWLCHSCHRCSWLCHSCHRYSWLCHSCYRDGFSRRGCDRRWLPRASHGDAVAITSRSNGTSAPLRIPGPARNRRGLDRLEPATSHHVVAASNRGQHRYWSPESRRAIRSGH